MIKQTLPGPEFSKIILRRVGMVLIIFGLVDIAFMVYSIVNDLNYSSSFNIFAVIAGIYLWRGNLGAVRIVTFFAAFMMTGFTAMLLGFPFFGPWQYVLIQYRLHPLTIVLSSLLGVTALVIVYWVYFQLRREPVLLARRAAGQNTAAPRLAFIAGLALVMFLGGMMAYTLRGPTGQKALQLARQQYGPQYHYVITSLRSSGGHVQVELVAINDRETKRVSVDWNE